MSNNIQISYSGEFEEKDFSEIAKFQNVSIKGAYVEKSAEAVGGAIITIVVAPFLEGFLKGFFGRLGERLGTRAADGAISRLSQLMEYLTKIIKKHRGKTRIVIRSSYTTKYGEAQVDISFSDISKLSDEEKMAFPHEIGAKLITRLDSQDECIRKIGVTCDNSEVTDFFYINDKLEVFEAEL